MNNNSSQIPKQEIIFSESHCERIAGLSFKNLSRISEAIAILNEVEADTWHLNWTADQEQDLVEAVNRLCFLHQSLSEHQEKEAA